MSDFRPSQRLALLLRLSSGALSEAGHTFWTHPQLGKAFPEYLFRLHCSVRATVPLMETARERARALAPTCPVAAQLVSYLTKHIREETNHDEWLLADMAILGHDRETVLSRIPPSEVATLIGTLYYWVLHAHPVALLAYFFVVEGNPITVELLDEVAARTGLPKKALRTFYKHARLDIKHGADVAEVLDELPLTEQHLALLGVTTLTIVEQLLVFMERLIRFADEMEPASTTAVVDAA